MISRILCASLAAIAPAFLVGQTGKTVLYAAAVNELTQYDLDPTNATLTKRGSVMLPASVQEAWPHPSHKLLYVAWSNGGAGTSRLPPIPALQRRWRPARRHGFRIDPASGALVVMAKPVSLSSRPIFITTDIDGTHIIAAYNDPSALTVHPHVRTARLDHWFSRPVRSISGVWTSGAGGPVGKDSHSCDPRKWTDGCDG